MDLTVARLKVLGETDIANLDKKISEYKSTSNTTILNKDLAAIQQEIQRAQQKYSQLEHENWEIKQRHTAANQQRDEHNKRYKELESEHQKMLSEIDEIFIQQQDYNSQITTKKAEVDKCLALLNTERHKLKSIIETHKKQDTWYQDNLDIIRESIKKVENEIMEHRQLAFQKYLDYEAALKEVSLGTITARNPINLSFTELVPDLLKTFAANMGNFVKVRDLYKKVLDTDYRSVKKAIKSCEYDTTEFIHYNICEETANLISNDLKQKKQELELCNKSVLPQKTAKYIEFLSTNLIPFSKETNNTTKLKVCYKCKYKLPYKYIPGDAGSFVGSTMPFDLEPFNDYLQQNYKKLCQNIITDAKLNDIIQKTTYAELFDMLGSVFDIKGYNTYEFLLFLAFLGTGGKAHNLYEEF